MKTIASLSERAILVTLSIHLWGGERTDRQISEEVTLAKGANSNRGKFTKKLITGSELKTLQNVAQRIRAYHMQTTLPWQTGLRILPKSEWQRYTEGVGVLTTEFNQAVENFAVALPRLKEDSKKELGTLFNDADYPTPDEIKSACKLLTFMYPLPEEGDWRLHLANEQTMAIRSDIEEQVHRAQYEAHKVAHARIVEAVTKLKERMETDSSGRGNGLHSGTIQRIADICELVQGVGFEDPVLEEAIVKIKALAAQPFTSLAKDEIVRRETARQAEDIAKTLQACFPQLVEE